MPGGRRCLLQANGFQLRGRRPDARRRGASGALDVAGERAVDGRGRRKGASAQVQPAARIAAPRSPYEQVKGPGGSRGAPLRSSRRPRMPALRPLGSGWVRGSAARGRPLYLLPNLRSHRLFGQPLSAPPGTLNQRDPFWLGSPACRTAPHLHQRAAIATDILLQSSELPAALFEPSLNGAARPRLPYTPLTGPRSGGGAPRLYKASGGLKGHPDPPPQRRDRSPGCPWLRQWGLDRRRVDGRASEPRRWASLQLGRWRRRRPTPHPPPPCAAHPTACSLPAQRARFE